MNKSIFRINRDRLIGISLILTLLQAITLIPVFIIQGIIITGGDYNSYPNLVDWYHWSEGGKPIVEYFTIFLLLYIPVEKKKDVRILWAIKLLILATQFLTLSVTFYAIITNQLLPDIFIEFFGSRVYLVFWAGLTVSYWTLLIGGLGYAVRMYPDEEASYIEYKNISEKLAKELSEANEKTNQLQKEIETLNDSLQINNGSIGVKDIVLALINQDIQMKDIYEIAKNTGLPMNVVARIINENKKEVELNGK